MGRKKTCNQTFRFCGQLPDNAIIGSAGALSDETVTIVCDNIHLNPSMAHRKLVFSADCDALFEGVEKLSASKYPKSSLKLEQLDVISQIIQEVKDRSEMVKIYFFTTLLERVGSSQINENTKEDFLEWGRDLSKAYAVSSDTPTITFEQLKRLAGAVADSSSGELKASSTVSRYLNKLVEHIKAEKSQG